jgi:SAM-dependent methyltransferase
MPADRPWLCRLLERWRRPRPPGRYDYARIRLSSADIEAKAYRRHLGGGDEQWDRRGRFQVVMLRTLGLEPHHRLLDAGCGPLRAGVHLIDALAERCYCGIDFNPDFITTARFLVAADERLAAKAARLECLDDFACERLGDDRFDWVLAFSVLNHCDAATRRAFFDRVPGVLAPSATIVITHADWFDQSLLHGGPLHVRRVLRVPDDLEPGIDITAWGFAPPPEGRMFPIVVLTARPEPSGGRS